MQDKIRSVPPEVAPVPEVVSGAPHEGHPELAEAEAPSPLAAPGSTGPFLRPCSYARYATVHCLLVSRFLATSSACKGLLL